LFPRQPPVPDRHQQAIRAKAEALGLPLEVDEPAKAVKQGQPQYPREAYSRCLEGTVMVMVVIDSAGSVAEAEVLESQPGLDDAAIKCVKDWRFRSARKAGQPVGVVGVVPVTFLIGDRSRSKGCPSETGQNLSGLQFDPQGADFTLWVNRFKDEVYRNWNIPTNLDAAGGHVDFEFVVERDGTMSSLRVEKSSGTSSLDKAAEFALRGSRLLPLPDDYRRPRITMHVTFHYNDYPR
jgi:TonB family protein